MQLAAEWRERLTPKNKPLHGEEILDTLVDLIPSFDWFVGNEFFEGMNDVIAYAKFNNGRQIFLKEEVYEALKTPGTEKYKRALFVVAHEIGHVLLHHRTRKSFARNKLGSVENYRVEATKEIEANIFAGSLIVPTDTIDPDISEYTISKVFDASYKVSAVCRKEARLYQAWQKGRK
ncbi:MAG: ImmA/IrrE family metallo-endopeptidase [Roseovarius confluentis]